MSALIDKIRASRQSQIEVGGWSFTVRRPTELEWHEMRGVIDTRRLMAFVDGWSGVKESDIINGGDPHPVPFDRAVLMAWVEDLPDVMSAIVKGVTASRIARAEDAQEREKN